MIPSTLQSGQISLTSLRRQELHLDADRRGDSGVIMIFVHPVAGAREADVGDLAQADVEAGLFLERLVERDRIFVDLPDRIAEVEERQEARRVPGRARGQFLALDENAVAPAFLGEMIERRDADHAPADDHRPRMLSHADTQASPSRADRSLPPLRGKVSAGGRRMRGPARSATMQRASRRELLIRPRFQRVHLLPQGEKVDPLPQGQKGIRRHEAADSAGAYRLRRPVDPAPLCLPIRLRHCQ